MITELVLLLVTAYLIFLIAKPKRPKNFPPGPPGLPIVGAGPRLSSLGSTAHQAFTQLGKIYGPITGLYLGPNRFIIINGYEATKQFYARDEFSHRPDLFTWNYRWVDRALGVFFSNGRLWQEQRRFTIRHLRDFGFGKTSMEGLIHEEAEECIGSIKKALKVAGPSQVIPVDSQFGVSVINILWAIMGGTRYSHGDEQFKQMLKKIQASFRAGNASGNMVNFYPFLRHFPYFKQEFADLTEGLTAIVEMLEETIAEHNKTRDPESKPRDLIDVYLEELGKHETDPNSTFSKDQLIQICVDLFSAGAESTSNSIAFAVLHMVRNPLCQQKVQEELDMAIGRGRFPSYDDKASLPYTFAVITESFRMTPVAPVSVPHYNLEDTEFMGYNIPKNTWASVNYPSTNMDEGYWSDPDTFRPERFLDENANFDKTKLDHVFGFGAGKRQCLGESLARITNFILFTTIMQRFKFQSVEGSPLPSLQPVDGFTVSPQPFSAKVTARF